jgi:hypothetical protein
MFRESRNLQQFQKIGLNILEIINSFKN